METENYCQKVSDLVGDEIRKGTVIRNLDAMRLIPALLETVHVSRDLMKAEMNRHLDGIRSDDRADAVLDAIGFRMKKEERKVWRVVSLKDRTQERLDSFLVVDEDAFRKNLEQISDCLFRTEQRETEYRKCMEERVLKMSEEKEESTGSYAECRDELAFLRRAAAEQIQYMLMQTGQEKTDRETAKGLYDLLEIFDIEAVWEAEDESSMFTVLKQGQTGGCRNKPCMMHEGEILVKGLRFDTMS
ncbi:MAG: hypothetical protein LUE14_13350 [Clostridiales bacterium]|nr:hypothetical protein [Clostridiales bacterium]